MLLQVILIFFVCGAYARWINRRNVSYDLSFASELLVR